SHLAEPECHVASPCPGHDGGEGGTLAWRSSASTGWGRAPRRCCGRWARRRAPRSSAAPSATWCSGALRRTRAGTSTSRCRRARWSSRAAAPSGCAAPAWCSTPSTAPAGRAVRRAAPGLERVSPERVRDELLILLALPDTARALRRADALGLLAVVVPEIEAMRVTAQPAPHRFDVLEHSLRAVAGCDRLLARLDALAPYGEELATHVAEPLGGGARRGAALKLAALLHDVSKPETRRRVEGRVRFFEHDVLGARRARAIGERLRLPERVTAVVERVVRHHLRPMHLGHAAAITPRARYRFYRDLRE